MAIKEATRRFRNEIVTPSVLPFAEFKAASCQFRPVIQRVSQQISVLQQALVQVEEEEDNPEVRGQLESLRQRMRALQRQHDAAEKAYSVLAQTMRDFEQQKTTLIQLIARNE